MNWVAVDRTSPVSLTDQVFLQIRRSILDGLLPGGLKLPSTRQLAEDLGISRNIAVLVYEQLTAESYIETRRGKGTFVCRNLLMKNAPLPEEHPPRFTRKEEHPPVNFIGSIPELNEFPVAAWVKSYKTRMFYGGPEILNYPDPTGETEFRQELSLYLLRSRGLIARPENILITAGSSHNFTIVSEVLNASGRIVLEDPFLRSITAQFRSLGKEILPVRVDKNGLQVGKIPRTDWDFAVTTPSHQYPLAVTLSADRRLELIERAEESGGFLFEDDYDSEFRYGGNRLSSLYSLAPKRVIYSATFSKSVSPGLRLAYLIVPDELLERFKNHLKIRFLAVNKPEQLAMADFIRSGSLERNLAKMRKTYKQRFTVLKQFVSEFFADRAVIESNHSGLHLVLRFTDRSFTAKDLTELKHRGLAAETAALHAINPLDEDFSRIIVPFASLPEQSLIRGLDILKVFTDLT